MITTVRGNRQKKTAPSGQNTKKMRGRDPNFANGRQSFIEIPVCICILWYDILRFEQVGLIPEIAKKIIISRKE
jgi:hypothetical protein